MYIWEGLPDEQSQRDGQVVPGVPGGRAQRKGECAAAGEEGREEKGNHTFTGRYDTRKGGPVDMCGRGGSSEACRLTWGRPGLKGGRIHAFHRKNKINNGEGK